MINERLKTRLNKDRPNTTISLRIPADVVDSLKAATRGFTAYQTLLRSAGPMIVGLLACSGLARLWHRQIGTVRLPSS
jgi:hypothetical protein